MLQTRLTFLQGSGCRYALTASWVSSDPAHSSPGLLERAGFAPGRHRPRVLGRGPSHRRVRLPGYACPDCAARKLDRPAPARELYVSQLFEKASAYATAARDRRYVLSAKHGLVQPDTVLEPYDVRLGARHPTATPSSSGPRWSKGS
jgi:hypothetical protein